MNIDNFTMERVALTVSLICNLKCKLCSAYAPYTIEQKFPSLTTLKGYINQYFSIVDYVNLFTISGGEPLLYKQLPELILELLKYIDKIGKIEIVSNGTIIPNEQLINSVQMLGEKFSRFLIDDYGKSLSTKTDEIDCVLKKNKLSYDIRSNNIEKMHCGGWVDFGSLEEIIHTPDETEKVFHKCALSQKMHFCFGITYGYLFPCAQVYRRLSLGQIVDSNDYINLMDTSISVKEKQKKIIDIYNAKHLETCAYCNGMCDDSPRFTPAEQFTNEELRKIKEFARNQKEIKT